MSYCVNCGVELDNSAKKCALCDTKVLNPKNKKVEEKKPFSQIEYVPTNVQKQFVSYIISMVMLIPTIICVLCNILIFTASRWSIGVVSTMFSIWIVFVFPFMTTKLRPFLLWAFDTFAIGLHIYLCFLVASLNTDIFFEAVLPYVIITSISILIYMLWIKKSKRHWLLRMIFIISAVGSISFSGGVITYFLGYSSLLFSSGLIVLASCTALVGFLIFCYSSKRMRKWLSDKFFI